MRPEHNQEPQKQGFLEKAGNKISDAAGSAKHGWRKWRMAEKVRGWHMNSVQLGELERGLEQAKNRVADQARTQQTAYDQAISKIHDLTRDLIPNLTREDIELELLNRLERRYDTKGERKGLADELIEASAEQENYDNVMARRLPTAALGLRWKHEKRPQEVDEETEEQTMARRQDLDQRRFEANNKIASQKDVPDKDQIDSAFKEALETTQQYGEHLHTQKQMENYEQNFARFRERFVDVDNQQLEENLGESGNYNTLTWGHTLEELLNDNLEELASATVEKNSDAFTDENGNKVTLKEFTGVPDAYVNGYNLDIREVNRLIDSRQRQHDVIQGVLSSNDMSREEKTLQLKSLLQDFENTERQLQQAINAAASSLPELSKNAAYLRLKGEDLNERLGAISHLEQNFNPSLLGKAHSWYIKNLLTDHRDYSASLSFAQDKDTPCVIISEKLGPYGSIEQTTEMEGATKEMLLEALVEFREFCKQHPSYGLAVNPILGLFNIEFSLLFGRAVTTTQNGSLATLDFEDEKSLKKYLEFVKKRVENANKDTQSQIVASPVEDAQGTHYTNSGSRQQENETQENEQSDEENETQEDEESEENTSVGFSFS